MNTTEIAKRYVALCREGQFDECLDALFAEEAISVEAGAPPGEQRTSEGLDAIRHKGRTWTDNHIIHSTEVFGPYPHDDRFAVRFVFDITNKRTQKRMTLDEVGLFTVRNGKIVQEEFFYALG